MDGLCKSPWPARLSIRGALIRSERGSLAAAGAGLAGLRALLGADSERLRALLFAALIRADSERLSRARMGLSGRALWALSALGSLGRADSIRSERRANFRASLQKFGALILSDCAALSRPIAPRSEI